MVVLPHAIEVNDFDRAIATIAQALNIRDPASPPITDWPADSNGRLDAIQAYIVQEISVLRT